MKKILPFILVLVLALTGIAAADAPYRMTISITDSGSSYETDVTVSTGDKVSIRLGDTNVTMSIEEKQAEGLNLSFKPSLEYKDEQYGVADIGAVLLPAGSVNSYTEPGKDSPVLTISWTQLSLPAQYEEIVSLTAEVLKGNHAVDENDSISTIFHMLAGTDYSENAGFYVTDLDNDGTPELLLGENQPMAESTVFYDLFTILDGELIHVFDGWDRNRYYLTANGGVANEGSSSAFMSSTAYYYYNAGELHLMEALIYDSNADPNNPWHLSTRSASEVSDSDQLLTESEAQYIKAAYPYQKVELDSFAK